MADRRHVLRFTVKAARWDTAERLAARRIRAYTNERKRGPKAVTDAQVLRDAVFTAVPAEGNTPVWVIQVEVTV